jgi:hypothetical protein
MAGQRESAPAPDAGERAAMKAVRRFCLQCQGEVSHFVRECLDGACALRFFRLPDAPAVHEEAGRALRAVRRHCLVCAGDRKEARACQAEENCPLWPYRFGVLPSTYQRVTGRRTNPRELWLPGLRPEKR